MIAIGFSIDRWLSSHWCADGKMQHGRHDSCYVCARAGQHDPEIAVENRWLAGYASDLEYQASLNGGRRCMLPEQVEHLRWLADHGVPQRELARRFAISPRSVRRCLREEKYLEAVGH